MNWKSLNAIIGESAAIVALRETIRTIAPSKLSVLIEGPTGSGKELVAAALHAMSGRRGDYVAFNVCAISDSMFDDALFGHVRGAYTGALGDSPGFLREANGGTVFLDEIGVLHPTLQAKLLRALETGSFRPVGAKHDAISEFRVVSATNVSRAELVETGRLRADLGYRLAGALLRVPPLSERVEDIPLLVRSFLTRMGVADTIDHVVLDLLVAHSWPGNVRELRNVIECAVALGGLDTRTVSQLIAQGKDGTVLTALMARRQELRAALDANAWDPEATARALGVHRATIYRWINECGLVAPALSQPSRNGRAAHRDKRETPAG
ncbi:MAG TPA: sigma 54-interacting transcriptional regulator [Gemmatimonadaceae bacterium]|nr:sigma 54-interacting transcriptional regulator [Gemmatimonadaceae bacterium]